MLIPETSPLERRALQQTPERSSTADQIPQHEPLESFHASGKAAPTAAPPADAATPSLAAAPPALALASILETLAPALMPLRKLDLKDIAPQDLPLAQAISQHPLLGDPDPTSLTSLEVQRTWDRVNELELDDQQRQSLVSLSKQLGVEPPQQRYLQAIERVFGPPRLTADGNVERRTRIISTIGPKSADVETLSAMIRNGTDVARLNFSHIENFEQAKGLVDVLHHAMQTAGRNIAIMEDLPGPKIRVADLAAPLEAPLGKKFYLGKTPQSGDDRLNVAPPQILNDLNVGDRMFIDDGLIALQVTAKDADGLQAEVVNARRGAVIKSRKGLNLPDTRLAERVPTERDLQKMQWMKQLGIHVVAASYVEDAADVANVRDAYNAIHVDGAEAWTGPPCIVSKVERPQALQNLAAIYQASDAIMVARGDLAVEIGEERVPVAQQRMNRLGYTACVPTGTATQMLETMTADPRPTRAEVSDVARAVMEGSAFVMTSEETAMGVDPPHVVATMAKIVTATEEALHSGQAHQQI